MIRLWIVQILSVLRLEMRKTFFARRGLWVYLLALAPVFLFTAHSINAPRQQARLQRIAAAHPVNKWAMLLIHQGMTREQVIKRLGEPYWEIFAGPPPLPVAGLKRSEHFGDRRATASGGDCQWVRIRRGPRERQQLRDGR